LESPAGCIGKSDGPTGWIERLDEFLHTYFIEQRPLQHVAVARSKIVGGLVNKIVIIGAGQAGASVAARLRTAGHSGQITLFGEERSLPYERPPLSKAYLLGKVGRERLLLRHADFYAENRIEVKTDCHIEAIDLAGKCILTAGVAHSYDHLVLTTGSRPIRFPEASGGALPGIHAIRTLADVEALAAECRAGARALLLGGGYVGLEAAAAFRGLGMAVTLVELSDRILQRVAAPETSKYFRALHENHGVDIREGVGVVRLSGHDRIESATLTTGEVLAVDLVIVGIGARPNDALARVAGLATDHGIVVDARGQTSDPFVWAAGDCTMFPYRGRLIRLESVQNAIDQAHTVADNLMGAQRDYVPLPWFWSDQFDIKLQIAGLNIGSDRIVVRSGARAGAVSHWYFAGEELVAVDAMNDSRSFMCAKRLLESGKSPTPDAVADPNRDLKNLLPA
jgi:3-phenylpropionate/trans-cinnamate dioxygenase ferredoxin reductase subunit